MKGLTVWQPWASLIGIGAKPYEFRGWRPPASIIGQRIAIHAAARPLKIREVQGLIESINGAEGGLTACLRAEIALPFLERLARGLANSPDTLFGTEDAALCPLSAIICTAIVGEPKRGDLCAAEFGIDHGGNDSDRNDHFNWGWPMLEVQWTPPIPFRGAQGFFNVPDHLIRSAA